MITALNEANGEEIELATGSPEDIALAWQTAQQYEKVAKKLKDQLKPLIPALLLDGEKSRPLGKFMFKRNLVQRFTYNKQAIRDVFDDDMLDLFTKVSKTAVDGYVKEHRSELDDDAVAELKRGLEPDGAAYEVIKLERIEK